MPVMSVRLSEKEANLIQVLAAEDAKEKSAEARELIMDGIKFKLIRNYNQRKASLGTLARKMGMTVSEAIDFLAELGIPAPISYQDYLDAVNTCEADFWKSAQTMPKRKSKRRR